MKSKQTGYKSNDPNSSSKSNFPKKCWFCLKSKRCANHDFSNCNFNYKNSNKRSYSRSSKSQDYKKQKKEEVNFVEENKKISEVANFQIRLLALTLPSNLKSSAVRCLRNHLIFGMNSIMMKSIIDAIVNALSYWKLP